MFRETQKPDFAQIAHCYGPRDAMRAWHQRGGMRGQELVEGWAC
jgi:hypothetical protein